MAKRKAFAAWKLRAELDNDGVAARLLEDHGIRVSEHTIRSILSGARNAGGKLAVALTQMTTLPERYFITSPSEAAPSAEKV